MISERQAEALLRECEKAIGRPLQRLRERIANQEKTLSSLWELIVLHSALSLGFVEHEQEQTSRPDVRVVLPRNRSVWIEAAYIYSRTRPAIEDASDFVNWVLRKLKTQDISCARKANAAILKREESEVFQVPKRNAWPRLLQSPSWSQFVEDARKSQCMPCRWVCPLGNVIIELGTLPQLGGGLITFPPSSESRDPRDHPVYKELADKAEQAKKWHRSGRSYQPLVLCMGAEDISEINSPLSGEGPLRRAIYSALMNVRTMSLSERINITGRIDGKNFRVGGSQYISAVLIVTIRPGTYLFTGPYSRPRARSILFTNPEAKSPLARDGIRLLQQLNFNSFEWGPGYETWQAPRGTPTVANTTVRRIRNQGGSTIMHYLSGGSFEIKIPVHVVARLLAGDISHEEVQTICNKDFVGRLNLALEQGQEIVGCEYVPARGKSRDCDRILLRYGPPKPPVIADPDKRGGIMDKRVRLPGVILQWSSGLVAYLCRRLRP